MSIGEDKIINNIVNLDIYGNEYGKIKHFGKNICRNNYDYFKSVFFSLDEYLNNIITLKKDEKPSYPIMEELGKKISFFLLTDIMTSTTWKINVLPMINSKDDWILGIISIINSLGIGKWKIREFLSEEKLIIDIYDSFEIFYYKEKKIDLDNYKPEFYFSIGLATSIMSLIYDTDITKQDKFEYNMNLFDECFDKSDAFFGKEVRFSSENYDYCEIIVERKH
jgi:hypothetical protein